MNLASVQGGKGRRHWSFNRSRKKKFLQNNIFELEGRDYKEILRIPPRRLSALLRLRGQQLRSTPSESCVWTAVTARSQGGAEHWGPRSLGTGSTGHAGGFAVKLRTV